MGTEKAELKQGVRPAVPTVPTVPTPKQIEDTRELADWEERAAILEFDGGFSRAEAESLALAELYPG